MKDIGKHHGDISMRPRKNITQCRFKVLNLEDCFAKTDFDNEIYGDATCRSATQLAKLPDSTLSNLGKDLGSRRRSKSVAGR